MHHRAMHIHDTLTFALLQGHLQLGILILDANEFLLELCLCLLLLSQLRLHVHVSPKGHRNQIFVLSA